MKILVYDGINGISLGKDIFSELSKIILEGVYCEDKQFQKTSFYGVKSAFAKIKNKRKNKGGFYHLPKLRENEFFDRVKSESPDAVIVIGFIYKYVSPQNLKDLQKSLGFKLFLYDTDSCNLYSRNREFVYFLESELPIYDLVFSFSKVTTSFFKNTLGINAVHLPFGANKIDTADIEKNTDILFVGTADLRRVFLLEHLKDQNINIFGARWGRNKPLISEELYSKVSPNSLWADKLYYKIHESKIILNITRSSFFGVETGINLRLFEALSAGAFLLTDYCEELESIFEVGREIETYRTASELKEKVKYYLENDTERKAIAKAGHEKFKKEYSWSIIADKMLSSIKDAN